MNRVRVKRRLVELATFALTDVDLGNGRTETIPATYTWAGDQVRSSTLYLGITTGANSVESISTRPSTDDRFVVTCSLVILGFLDGMVAESATESALNALDGVLRTSQRLVHLDVPSEMTDSEFAVAWARMVRVDGPWHSFPTPNTDFIVGGAEFDIECLSNLH